MSPSQYRATSALLRLFTILGVTLHQREADPSDPLLLRTQLEIENNIDRILSQHPVNGLKPFCSL